MMRIDSQPCMQVLVKDFASRDTAARPGAGAQSQASGQSQRIHAIGRPEASQRTSVAARRATRAIVDLFYNLAMPRLAWFSPLPPSRSGIAAYSAELIPLLSGTYAIDTFISGDADTPAFCGNLRNLWTNLGVPHYRSTDFIVRHQAHPYDLIVYHL